MIKPFVLLFFMLCAQPLSAEAANWHLLTQSRGGTVSLLKNLTRSECEFARARALGLPATDVEKKQDKERREKIAKECREHPETGWCTDFSLTPVEEGTIVMAECFQ